MVRPSNLVTAAVALAAVAVCASTHADSTLGSEGPSLARPPPRLTATLVADVATDGLAAPPTTLVATTRATVETAIPQALSEPCPGGMVLVDGDRCTEVRQDCAVWLDPQGTPLARCARFSPTVCTGGRSHERFCIDRDEYVASGESLPLGNVSWTDARRTCEAQGKRLCRETEWELACEGEEAFPYPTGYARDSAACNFDRGSLVDPTTGRLRDQRMPPESLERCVSPYGVRSMAGNVDEWVWREHSPGAWRSALKGGWWMAARERCRPATTSHGEHYSALQTGFRCCADAAE
jgi:hypothetical protein